MSGDGREKVRCGVVRREVEIPASSIMTTACLAKEMVEYHLGTWFYDPAAWGKIGSPPYFLQ